MTDAASRLHTLLESYIHEPTDQAHNAVGEFQRTANDVFGGMYSAFSAISLVAKNSHELSKTPAFRYVC